MDYRRAHRMHIVRMKGRNFGIMQERARRIGAYAKGTKESAGVTRSSFEDVVMFGRFARLQAINAAALAEAAAIKDRVEVRRAFERLTPTCNNCHAAFRGAHGKNPQKGGRL